MSYLFSSSLAYFLHRVAGDWTACRSRYFGARVSSGLCWATCIQHFVSLFCYVHDHYDVRRYYAAHSRTAKLYTHYNNFFRLALYIIAVAV